MLREHLLAPDNSDLEAQHSEIPPLSRVFVLYFIYTDEEVFRRAGEFLVRRLQSNSSLEHI